MGLRLRLRLTYRGDVENVHRYFRLSVALPSGYDLLIVSHEEKRDISVYGVPRITWHYPLLSYFPSLACYVKSHFHPIVHSRYTMTSVESLKGYPSSRYRLWYALPSG